MSNKLNSFKNYVPYINGHEDMKRSSVLIPLINYNDDIYVLFQVRSSNLRTQPNEISFPGGRIELNETPKEACIRETFEEIGTSSIDVLCELDTFISPSNLIIHPFLGFITDYDKIKINKDEVDHLFTVPLKYLLNHEPVSFESKVQIVVSDKDVYNMIPQNNDYKFQDGSYSILFYKYKEYTIWGITAKILHSFLDRYKVL